MDAKTLIIELGDYVAVGERVGVSAQTVATWKTRNSIPRHVWPDMLEAFPRRVTMSKLRQTERAA